MQRDPDVGDVLLKNYASLDKYETKFHMFFSEKVVIDLPKHIRTYLKDQKREPKCPSLAKFAEQFQFLCQCRPLCERICDVSTGTSWFFLRRLLVKTLNRKQLL